MTSARAANKPACRRSYSDLGGVVRHHQFGGPVEVNLSQRELGLALIDTGNSGAQQGNLVVDVLDGVLQRPAPAPGLRFDPAYLGFRYL